MPSLHFKPPYTEGFTSILYQSLTVVYQSVPWISLETAGGSYQHMYGDEARLLKVPD
jgi:hypothetical protein